MEKDIQPIMTAGRTINTLSQDWCTPQKYTEAVRNFFGGEIELDPCSNKHSIVGARVEYVLPKNNGLRDSWNFKTIYVNPPYGRDKNGHGSIRDWLKRCADAHDKHHSEVLALIPVAPNTRHWKEHIFGKASHVCFLADTRLKFRINGSEVGKGAPMACAIIYWGQNKKRFYQVFSDSGAIADISGLINSETSVKRESQRELSFA